MTKICDECETAAHCLKHGCIPKQSTLDKMAEHAREVGLDYEPAQQHGWKLVPLEPTQEMIDAVPTKPHPTRPNGWGDRNVAIYKAMIVAAPQPSETGVTNEHHPHHQSTVRTTKP